MRNFAMAAGLMALLFFLSDEPVVQGGQSAACAGGQPVANCAGQITRAADCSGQAPVANCGGHTGTYSDCAGRTRMRRVKSVTYSARASSCSGARSTSTSTVHYIGWGHARRMARQQAKAAAIEAALNGVTP